MTHSITTPTAKAPRQRRRVVWTVLALAVVGAIIATVVILVSGAGASSDPADAPAVLVTQADFQPGATPPCLMHQTDQPNSAYEGGPDSQPPQQLTFLAYYTAAGKLPFCDGSPATDTDKAWAQLYVQLTTAADNVSTVLG